MATPAVASKEGTIPFVRDGETYQTWYKLYGSLENRTRPPLIALHGGPGLVHNYLTPLGQLAEDTNSPVPVILYDQLGNGRSTHLRSKPNSFWSIQLLVDELANLLAFFGIEDAFDLYGHSWGGVVIAEFAVRVKPRGLRHLVLSDSLPSMALWMQSTFQLMQAFPKEVQEGLMKGMADPAGYRKALHEFHAVHGCTLKPCPDEYYYTLDQAVVEDVTVPTALFSGEFKDWSIIDKLDQIRAPTLVLNGRHDISQDFVNQPFFDRIPKVKWVTLENSSHTPMWEEPERYLSLIKDFLKM